MTRAHQATSRPWHATHATLINQPNTLKISPRRAWPIAEKSCVPVRPTAGDLPGPRQKATLAAIIGGKDYPKANAIRSAIS